MSMSINPGDNFNIEPEDNSARIESKKAQKNSVDQKISSLKAKIKGLNSRLEHGNTTVKIKAFVALFFAQRALHSKQKASASLGSEIKKLGGPAAEAVRASLQRVTDSHVSTDSHGKVSNDEEPPTKAFIEQQSRELAPPSPDINYAQFDGLKLEFDDEPESDFEKVPSQEPMAAENPVGKFKWNDKKMLRAFKMRVLARSEGQEQYDKQDLVTFINDIFNDNESDFSKYGFQKGKQLFISLLDDPTVTSTTLEQKLETIISQLPPDDLDLHTELQALQPPPQEPKAAGNPVEKFKRNDKKLLRAFKIRVLARSERQEQYDKQDLVSFINDIFNDYESDFSKYGFQKGKQLFISLLDDPTVTSTTLEQKLETIISQLPPDDLDLHTELQALQPPPPATKPEKNRIKDFDSSDTSIMREFRRQLLARASNQKSYDKEFLLDYINKYFDLQYKDRLSADKFIDIKQLFISSLDDTNVENTTLKDRLGVIDTLSRSRRRRK